MFSLGLNYVIHRFEINNHDLFDSTTRRRMIVKVNVKFK